MLNIPDKLKNSALGFLGLNLIAAAFILGFSIIRSFFLDETIMHLFVSSLDTFIAIILTIGLALLGMYLSDKGFGEL